MTYCYNGITITRNMTIRELLDQFENKDDVSVYIKNRYGKRAVGSDLDLIVDIDNTITIDPNQYCKSMLITCHVLENDQNKE